MTILVCDDDKEIVEAIEIYLLQEGFSVEKAYDGEQALEILKKKSIDLMIIDVMMPKLDGIRATFQVRKTEQYSNYYPVSKDAGYGQNPWSERRRRRLCIQAVQSTGAGCKGQIPVAQIYNIVEWCTGRDGV